MNRKPQTRFDPSSPLLRKVFAVAAVAATLATAGLIEALALGYGTSAPLLIKVGSGSSQGLLRVSAQARVAGPTTNLAGNDPGSVLVTGIDSRCGSLLE